MKYVKERSSIIVVTLSVMQTPLAISQQDFLSYLLSCHKKYSFWTSSCFNASNPDRIEALTYE